MDSWCASLSVRAWFRARTARSMSRLLAAVPVISKLSHATSKRLSSSAAQPRADPVGWRRPAGGSERLELGAPRGQDLLLQRSPRAGPAAVQPPSLCRPRASGSSSDPMGFSHGQKRLRLIGQSHTQSLCSLFRRRWRRPWIANRRSRLQMLICWRRRS
jgi:hypothetical protein